MTDHPHAVRFAALGCAFGIVANDAEVAAYVERLFRHLDAPVGSADDRTYRVTVASDGSADVSVGGTRLPASRSMPPLAALLRDIDEHLIARSPRLLIHASAAVHGTGGIAFPGRTGTGKSTLVAALVEMGFGYLTDEFVSPDWETGIVPAYARPIALYRDSWEALPRLEPSVPERIAPLVTGQWLVDPDDIRSGAVGGPSRLSHLIFPTRLAGTPARLQPMPRPEALLALVECTFHFHRHGERAFTVLADLVRECDCWRLTYSDVTDACDAVCAGITAKPPVDAS